MIKGGSLLRILDVDEDVCFLALCRESGSTLLTQSLHKMFPDSILTLNSIFYIHIFRHFLLTLSKEGYRVRYPKPHALHLTICSSTIIQEFRRASTAILDVERGQADCLGNPAFSPYLE